MSKSKSGIKTAVKLLVKTQMSKGTQDNGLIKKVYISERIANFPFMQITQL